MARKKAVEVAEPVVKEVVVPTEPVFSSIDKQLTRAWLHTEEQSFSHLDYQFMIVRAKGSLRTELRMLTKSATPEWVVGTVDFIDGAGATQWKTGIQEKAESMIKEFGIAG